MTGIDLRSAARAAATEHGFIVDETPADTLAEIPIATLADGARDLRDLLWSSIDNADTRDLDQLEVAEGADGADAIRVRIAIADVDRYVVAGSALDVRAAANTTSVYTGVETFPMLPERLSTDLTSLREGVTRAAMVVDFVVDGDGGMHDVAIYAALVCNRAKLAYPDVGAWLAGNAPPPNAMRARPALAEQLRLQADAAQRLRDVRHRHGALDFETVEAQPVAVNGRVVDITLVHKDQARDLIEDFMIAANVATASFLEGRGFASLRRIVRAPKRWPRIVELASRLGASLPPEPDALALSTFLAAQRAKSPGTFADLSLSVVKLIGAGEYAVEVPGGTEAGHFGLAVRDYTHSTAPNRRYADLVTQRQLKAAVAGRASPYTPESLATIAQHCTDMENEANVVEREVRKMAAASLLAPRTGETFSAVVTGDTPKGVFVRLVHPPAEGRVIRGEQGMDVGDAVTVRLVSTDPARGFIDFARA